MASLRLDELFKYFQATSHAVALEDNDIDSTRGYRPDLARLSQDPVLNALTQLGVARLGVERAFVSLIDDENQYVVAEMTNSISLFHTSHHKENDSVCIGTQKLDLHAGVCASTMPAFTSARNHDAPFRSTPNAFANSSRYIINDLAQEPQFADRPYVVGYPYMRYYAEVPITSQAGFVIGTYAVLDNKPGNGLSAENYSIMHEISVAIMRHIESIKMQEDYKHAMRLLSGVNSFVQNTPNVIQEGQKGKRNSLHSSKSWRRESQGDLLAEDDEEAVSELSPSLPSVITANQSSSGDDGHLIASPKQPSPANPPAQTSYPDGGQHDLTSAVTLPSMARPANEQGFHRQEPALSADGTASLGVQSTNSDDAFSLDEATHACFARAAHLLREALKLEGVVFIDTNVHNFDFSESLSRKTSLDSIKLDPSAMPGNGVGVGGDGFLHSSQTHEPTPPSSPISRSVMCRRLGIATRDVPAPDVKSTHLRHHSLSEAAYQELLHLCPGGCVINVHTAGNVWLQVTQGIPGPVAGIDTVGQEVRQNFPRARSVVFVPLWNPHTDRWFAGCLAWSTDPKRVLDSSDVAYLTGFGNSVMAEVVRLELLATNKAKSDFVSCISHELRSPLHGILGSTEMLKESALQEDHHQLVSMIDSCATILLETMDNILYYSKINSVAPKTEHRGLSSRDSAVPIASDRVSGAVATFNLGVLIEETCAALFAGHHYTSNSPLSKFLHGSRQEDTQSPDGLYPDSELEAAAQHANDVLMVLRMDHDAAQLIRCRPAAWRRCLLNIVGNALKYTTDGYVEIVLEPTRVTQSGSPAQQRKGVSLVVRDTGCGIGKAYLETQLFRPFAQENVHASGTGLGLSIVKSLVDDLEGSVKVVSEINTGTELTVTIPTVPVLDDKPSDQDMRPYSDLSICFVGFDIHSNPATPVVGITVPNAKRDSVIKDALLVYCEQWLGMKCSSARSGHEVSADILAITEDNLSLLEEELDNSGAKLQPASRTTWLVLCTRHGSNDGYEHKTANGVFYLSQPFGPKQLASTIAGIHRYRSEHASAVFKQPLVSFETEVSDLKICDAQKEVSTASASCSKQSPTSTESVHGQSRPSKHVLLVDDNDINLKLITRCVAQLGCEYVTAKDGKEAFEALKSSTKPFDYVFMDISMPVMDGFEATRAIRKFETAESLHRTPIIAMTGLGSEDARNEAVSSGMSAFWTKPVKMKMIRSLINNNEAMRTEGNILF